MKLFENSIRNHSFEKITLAGEAGKDSYYKSLYCDVSDTTFDLIIYRKTLKGKIIFFFSKIRRFIKLN